ncbi:glycoside hydrolase family 5 protein [Baudoinia panamericana UAMH 10762]|uniref:Glycoside hydrolase family 5 protein n=1 Tax=Baudoinia panamericana (strain UAMH 10762) TaxID=717646 RepID=M2MA19_BAUPA|nr:glycoside hydrolase family 5 protein [Baudoinia panamericana UAMH 10762]EMC93316.1 glycoside hydrolase family 5 protein [Baudoinia panamericana UAMH 10762]
MLSESFCSWLLLFSLALYTLGQSTSNDPIRGVNLGGWLVTEQWITPAVYQGTYANDEWHLCNQLGPKQCASTLRSHWSSFYVRDDLVAIRSAGLNRIRIPIGYWAVDLLPYEPYVSGQYPYLIRAVQWAGELGLSVIIDLHGAPGSQNGQDNSGLIGPVLFPSNASNVDRSLNVLRNLTEEFSSLVYNNTVIGVELLNEPRLSATFSMDQLKRFYTNGSAVVHDASTRSGFNVTIHDAFWGPQYWTNYNPSNAAASQPAQGLAIDTHQYYAFAPLNNLTAPQILQSICNISQLLKAPHSGIPPTVVGEWSLETGNSPVASSSDQNGNDNQARRTWFRLLAEAQMRAYSPTAEGQSSIGWIFWAWKTEYDIDTWSYRRGVADGWIPSIASNYSTYAFPVLANGCVDTTYNYTAPRKVGSAGMVSAGMLDSRLLALAALVCIAVAM